jgi:hypothetical protein
VLYLGDVRIPAASPSDFPQRLAERISTHVVPLRRYEAGPDEDLRLQFEPVSRFDE